ncbi:MAG TPA: alpha/beta family hydrolase, partial [Candidatus Solibacter sp.]
TIDLAGPEGRLEAVVNEGAPDAKFAALVCHPHPKGGGTMHNKVVYHAMKVLNAPEWGLRWPVLRFNFRGTGLSEGEHDGSDESNDVLAALNWLENEYALPIIATGFSFGAAMALKACTETGSSVRAIAALGLPTHAAGRTYRYSFLQHLSLPKLFVSGDRDQFASSAELETLVAAAPEPRKLVLVPGADHFFSGQLQLMQSALSGWLKEQVL